MRTVPEALAIVRANVPEPCVDEVDLTKALGHTLAEEIRADRDLPPWDKAMMDGYAVRAEDVARTPVELEVVGSGTAGRMPDRGVEGRQAARIMTGAPVPAGADCVVNLERTRPLSGGTRVSVDEGVARGAHVTPRGQDARAGDLLLPLGALVRPAEVGVLAGVGKARVQVFRRPTCAILATGDELVEVDAAPTGAQIRNSNAYALAAQAQSARLAVAHLGIVGDDRERMRARLRTAFQTDLVLTTGGVSVGDKDFVKECLVAEGAEILFDRVAIKPGKPLTFARRGRCRIFALPGNPASAFVGFEVFVRPFLAVFTRDPSVERAMVRARLLRAIANKGDRTMYVPARITGDGPDRVAEPVGWHGSGDFVGLSRANGLALIPPDGPGGKEGDAVDVLWLTP